LPVPMKATMRLPAVGAEASDAVSDVALPVVPAVAACETNGPLDAAVLPAGVLEGFT